MWASSIIATEILLSTNQSILTLMKVAKVPINRMISKTQETQSNYLRSQIFNDNRLLNNNQTLKITHH